MKRGTFFALMCCLAALLTSVPAAAISVQNRTTCDSTDGSGSYLTATFSATTTISGWTPQCGGMVRDLLVNQYFSNCAVAWCAEWYWGVAKQCVYSGQEQTDCCKSAGDSAAMCFLNHWFQSDCGT